jgi:dihydroflavonol-4-reductase
MTFRTAFVTGGTGLLGNNLVRALLDRGVAVRALVRSPEKAKAQFAGLDVEVICGDLRNIHGFAESLREQDVVFHTAAYYRESFQGGNHLRQLNKINVDGTSQLLSYCYSMGVRKFVHTSTAGVLDGPSGMPLEENMRRNPEDADDYFRSKILADLEVDAFLGSHPDFDASLVLPGWMYGPGDMGPTSSGRIVLNFLNRRLPGVPRGSFPVVDARDVAHSMIAAAERGGRGERYLAAGRHMTLADLFARLEKLTGISAPAMKIPAPALYAMAAAGEAWARLSHKPVFLSMATAKLMIRESGRSHYYHGKTDRELGTKFRPFEDTLRDVVAWYRSHGYVEFHSGHAA